MDQVVAARLAFVVVLGLALWRGHCDADAQSSATASASAEIVQDVGGLQPDGGVIGAGRVQVDDAGVQVNYE